MSRASSNLADAILAVLGQRAQESNIKIATVTEASAHTVRTIEEPENPYALMSCCKPVSAGDVVVAFTTNEGARLAFSGIERVSRAIQGKQELRPSIVILEEANYKNFGAESFANLVEDPAWSQYTPQPKRLIYHDPASNLSRAVEVKNWPHWPSWCQANNMGLGSFAEFVPVSGGSVLDPAFWPNWYVAEKPLRMRTLGDDRFMVMLSLEIILGNVEPRIKVDSDSKDAWYNYRKIPDCQTYHGITFIVFVLIDRAEVQWALALPTQFSNTGWFQNDAPILATLASSDHNLYHLSKHPLKSLEMVGSCAEGDFTLRQYASGDFSLVGYYSAGQTGTTAAHIWPSGNDPEFARMVYERKLVRAQFDFSESGEVNPQYVFNATVTNILSYCISLPIKGEYVDSGDGGIVNPTLNDHWFKNIENYVNNVMPLSSGNMRPTMRHGFENYLIENPVNPIVVGWWPGRALPSDPSTIGIDPTGGWWGGRHNSATLHAPLYIQRGGGNMWDNHLPVLGALAFEAVVGESAFSSYTYPAAASRGLLVARGGIVAYSGVFGFDNPFGESGLPPEPTGNYRHIDADRLEPGVFWSVAATRAGDFPKLVIEHTFDDRGEVSQKVVGTFPEVYCGTPPAKSRVGFLRSKVAKNLGLDMLWQDVWNPSDCFHEQPGFPPWCILKESIKPEGGS